jgi:hypothetical protein
MREFQVSSRRHSEHGATRRRAKKPDAQAAKTKVSVAGSGTPSTSLLCDSGYIVHRSISNY